MLTFCLALCLLPALSYGREGVSAGTQAKNDAQHSVDTPDDSAITANFEHAFQSYTEMPTLMWEPTQDITGRAIVSPVDIAKRDEWKDNWDRMAALLDRNGGKPYVVLMTVVSEKKRKVLWQQRLPIDDPKSFAEASRQLVPGPRIADNIDVPAALPFRIPAGTLPLGTYRILLTFLAPDGSEHRFPYTSTYETADRLLIRTLDKKKIVLSSHVADASPLLTHGVEIANPGHIQFPKNDPDDCQARSVWCLQAFEGRVFVGYGDWDMNRGPIAVWSFGPQAVQAEGLPPRFRFDAGQSPRLTFVQEFVVQEESIDRYHVCGDTLLIPGIDGNKEHGPDGFLFGSLYLREKGYWRKLSTIPRAQHVYDAIRWHGKLFAVGELPGVFVESKDDGLSWHAVDKGGNADGDEIVPFGKGLLLLAGTGVSLYRDGKSETRMLDLFPGYGVARAYRSTPFLDGIAYTTFHNWGRSRETRHPLFFLKDLQAGPKVVSLFADQAIRDLLVEGDTLYVLVAGTPQSRTQFPGEIYATRDLMNWTRLAAFTLPATPSAFARLQGVFYVGTANRGYDAATYGGDSNAHAYAFANTASGSIWQIEP